MALKWGRRGISQKVPEPPEVPEVPEVPNYDFNGRTYAIPGSTSRTSCPPEDWCTCGSHSHWLHCKWC